MKFVLLKFYPLCFPLVAVLRLSYTFWFLLFSLGHDSLIGGGGGEGGEGGRGVHSMLRCRDTFQKKVV